MRQSRRIALNCHTPLFLPFKRLILASGTFTVSATGKYYIRCVSGGSGGGGYRAYLGNYTNGGGGAVNEVCSEIKLGKGQIIPVVIGTGGAAGTNSTGSGSGGDGGEGGTTSFGKISVIGPLGGTGALSGSDGIPADGTYPGEKDLGGSVEIERFAVSGGNGGKASASGNTPSTAGTNGLVYIERTA